MSRITRVLASYGIFAFFGVVATDALASADISRRVSDHKGFEISAQFDKGLNENLLSTIRKLPEVEAAVPRMRRPTKLMLGKKSVEAIALGIDPEHEQEVHEYDIVQGNKLSIATGGVVVEESLAKANGIRVGDKINLMTRRALVSASVTGIYRKPDGSLDQTVPIILMSLSAAQYYYLSGREVDAIQFVLKKGINAGSVPSTVQKLLPAGSEIRELAAEVGAANKSSKPAQSAGGTK